MKFLPVFRQMKYINVLILVFCFLQHLSACDVDACLAQVSEEERKCLEYFFTMAIKKDHLGHVLFFTNKPASFVAASLCEKGRDDLFLQGWNVWLEKESLFPHPHFIIYDEIVNGELLHIYFINTATLDAKCSENKNLYNEIKMESFISDLRNKRIDSLFCADETLRGFLLGFGVESSKAFKAEKRRNNSFKPIFCAEAGKVKVESDRCFLKGSVHPVSFIGNPESEEVKGLCHLYAEELEVIEELVQKKELLQLVLRALTQ